MRLGVPFLPRTSGASSPGKCVWSRALVCRFHKWWIRLRRPLPDPLSVAQARSVRAICFEVASLNQQRLNCRPCVSALQLTAVFGIGGCSAMQNQSRANQKDDFGLRDGRLAADARSEEHTSEL